MKFFYLIFFKIRKETVALILLECLICLAQGPPMGPMGPMGPMIPMGYMEIDQTVGAPPPQIPEDGEQHFHEYYLTSNGPEVGAPPPPDMGPEFPQMIDQQMVGGPLDNFLNVKNVYSERVSSLRISILFSYSHYKYLRTQ